MNMTTKESRYETLVAQVAALIEGETCRMSVLANVTAALHDAFPEIFFWVGFYMVEDGELRLGPFQGPVACMHIACGKGVCGTVWAEKRTLVVPDVEDFPGHIACSSLSRSEIVVPVFGRGGSVKAVIDVDSCSLGAFDEVDARYLEKIAKNLSKELAL